MISSNGWPASRDKTEIKIKAYPVAGTSIKLQCAEDVVAAHNGTTIAPEPTIDEKLASVGLSISSLKSALGI